MDIVFFLLEVKIGVGDGAVEIGKGVSGVVLTGGDDEVLSFDARVDAKVVGD